MISVTGIRTREGAIDVLQLRSEYNAPDALLTFGGQPGLASKLLKAPNEAAGRAA